MSPHPGSLSDAEIEAGIARLEDEERRLSRRRAALQDRLDFVRAGGYAHLDVAERVDELMRQERALSTRRHELHAEIDALRAERSRRAAAFAAR